MLRIVASVQERDPYLWLITLLVLKDSHPLNMFFFFFLKIILYWMKRKGEDSPKEDGAVGL